MPHARPARRFRKQATAVALFALALSTGACTITERQVAQQDGRIDALQEQVIRLERSLAEGSGPAAPSALDPQLAQRLADLGQQVTHLGDQLRTVQGRLDALERRAEPATPSPLTTASLGQLEQDLKALAIRVAEVEAGALRAPPPSPPPAAAPSSSSSAQRATGQQLYDQGYTLYKQARYDDARQVLRQYAAEHPDTNLTDNALFWVGETYYDQAQYEQAILEYDKVVQKFPQGDKVASALLKQAFAFDAIGDPSDARILLRKVLREHPTSEQAAIARKKLEILGD